MSSLFLCLTNFMRFSFLNRKNTVQFVSLRAVFLLSLSGLLIGFLHDLDWVVALICLIRIAYFVGFSSKKTIDKDTVKVVYAGMFITMVLGAISEVLGIFFGFWEYHDLPNGRNFPYWLPLAWALSFLFLFRFESRLINVLQISSFKQKLFITAIASAIFPTIGEIITINLGVWTYYNMGPKLLGVPYLAMFLLMMLHTAIYTFLCYVCQKRQIKTRFFKF